MLKLGWMPKNISREKGGVTIHMREMGINETEKNSMIQFVGQLN